MSETTANNKRIVKNTMFLYVRMLLSLLVSLYTSRVVLNALGASDYGIYNVVGGVVVMFAFMSNTMATAAQRFMSYAIGRKDIKDLRNTFVVSRMILWTIALLVFILVSWTNVNSLPPLIFRLMYLSAVVVPLWINRNKFTPEILFAFVIISGSSFAVSYMPVDGMYISIVLLFTYIFSRPYVDRLQMPASFVILALLALSYVAKEQGVNILINIFFGTIVNAARGITSQVTGAVQGFISNFQVAMNPQITKYYAQRDYENLFKLVQRGAKFSLFLFFFLALPIFIDINYILQLWLVNVPEHTASFIRLTFILMMIEALSSPVITCLLAVGKVKWYQIIVGGLLIFNLPISYIAFHLGYAPEITIVIAIVISLISLIIRLIMLHFYIAFPIKQFIITVLVRAFFVIILSYYISYIFCSIILVTGFIHLVITLIISWFIAGLCILFVGMNKSERRIVYETVIKILRKTHFKK
jgi:Na+-driven multidrug efflux pump